MKWEMIEFVSYYCDYSNTPLTWRASEAGLRNEAKRFKELYRAGLLRRSFLAPRNDEKGAMTVPVSVSFDQCPLIKRGKQRRVCHEAAKSEFRRATGGKSAKECTQYVLDWADFVDRRPYTKLFAVSRKQKNLRCIAAGPSQLLFKNFNYVFETRQYTVFSFLRIRLIRIIAAANIKNIIFF